MENLTTSTDEFRLKRKQAHAYMGKANFQSKGVKLFHALIEQGDPDAAAELGDYYKLGDVEGLDQNESIKEAISILQKGVKQQHSRAIFKLAQLHISEDFQHLSGSKTLELLETGRKLKDRNCICLMASLYRNKEFCQQWQIPYQLPLVVQLYQEARKLGCEIAPCELATLYTNKQLGWADPIKAFFVLRPLLKQNDNRARQVWNHAKTKIKYESMIKLLEDLLLKGEDANGYYYIGKAYLKGWYNIQSSEIEAEKYWSLGVNKANNEKILYHLAKLYFNQESSFYNPAKAQLLRSQLSQKRSYLGYYYAILLKGESREKNYIQFIKWLDEKKENSPAYYYCGRYLTEKYNSELGYKNLLYAKEKNFAPAFCYLAEGYFLGYWGKEASISVCKELLVYARDHLKSFKASIMLENLNSRKFSRAIIAFKKQPGDDERIKLKEMLHRY